MRQVPIFFKAVAVYQQMLRTDIQLVNSTVHGKKGGIENIDFVNFFGRDDAHRPCQSLFFNHFTQGIALFFRQLLGVVQKFILKVRWQNNSSGIDRTGQTAATGLIASRLYQIFIQIR